MRTFEIPFILTISGDDREEALDDAMDLADYLPDIDDRIDAATAITTTDHNLLERLSIDPDGEEV